MGVSCKLAQITADETERLRADPRIVRSLVEAKKSARPTTAARKEQLTLFDVTSGPSPTVWLVDLHKLWDALHFLLDGAGADGTTLLSLAILGGEAVDPRGPGESRIVGRAEVRAIAEALSGLTHESLRRRFDPARFREAGIYPLGLWEEDDVEGLFSDLMAHFDGLARIYRDAAACGNAVLIAIG